VQSARGRLRDEKKKIEREARIAYQEKRIEEWERG
jgi:hypothetical protein